MQVAWLETVLMESLWHWPSSLGTGQKAGLPVTFGKSRPLWVLASTSKTGQDPAR